MNEEFTKHYKNVFIAIGDEGQSLGVYQHDYVLNKNKHKTKTYGGKEYDFVGDEKLTSYKTIAQAIHDGKIVGWFQVNLKVVIVH